MKATLSRISAAVRNAMGKPIVAALTARVHLAAAASEQRKEREANAKLPQPLRLWIQARQKRQCKKRRQGISAKTAGNARGRCQKGHSRLGAIR